MFVLQGLIGIPKVLKTFVNHDHNINKYWINDLHLKFLVLCLLLLKKPTLSIFPTESGAIWLHQRGVVSI